MKISLHIALLLLFSMLLPSCSSVHILSEVDESIIKSPADERLYRTIRLDNGLKVMLVSDPKADRSAAALDVYVGSGNDPKDRQGLAHYLEHMLFLGTKSYPEAGEYQQFISEHGGSHNAYTSLKHTNYFFNIAPDYLQGALDRFSQFFIAPLFNEQYIKRERAIVHSEYAARKNDEGRRLWMARRMVYNPEHPSTKFSVGSTKTLADRDGEPVREDLIAFYKRYYHAPRMALSIISPHSLDQLQSWVEAKFNAVSSQGEAYTAFEQPLIDKQHLPVTLKLKPIKEARQIIFSFPIGSVYEQTQTKPAQYLSNLLGHEGVGSLLENLKELAWANSLSAGLGYSDDVQATFDIKIGLSELGFEHIKEIGHLLFSTITLIREQGIKPMYFNELKQLAELDFQFQEKSSEQALVQRLASQLHRFDGTEILSVPYRYSTFKPEQVTQVLEFLKPGNCQLIIIDPALESTQKTPWYDVSYIVDNSNLAWFEDWQLGEENSEINLPQPNPFIPQDVDLISEQNPGMVMPNLLNGSTSVKVWHQTLLTFDQPKAELYFSLRSPEANVSARNAVLTSLYVRAVNETLNSEYYPASLAGLSYQLYRHSRGLSVRISGYSDKQAHLLKTIVSALQAPEIDQQHFDLYSENLRRKLLNSTKDRPSALVSGGLYDVLLTSSWSTTEKLDALKTINLKALQNHVMALLKGPDLLLLSIGNINQTDSLNAGEIVSSLLSKGVATQHVLRAKVRKLKAGKWQLHQVTSTHNDAAIALVFQGKSSDIDSLAATQLLGALISTPYYQTLRTEAQLGYIVSAFSFNLLEVPALGFQVQSNTHSVNQILKYTREFLRNYGNTLAAFPLTTFESTKKGLLARLMQEDKQLSQVASRDWAELDRKAYQFDTRKRLIAAIENIDLKTLNTYFWNLVLADEAAALLSYSYGNKANDLDTLGEVELLVLPSLDNVRDEMAQYF